VMKPESRQ